MTSEHQTTQEEKAFDRLLEEEWKTLSEAARTVIREARLAAYADNMVSSYCFGREEYEEAIEKMRHSAAELTDRDCELLKDVVRAAIAALASIDPFDLDTLVGYRVYRVNLHRYYEMISDMVQGTLIHRAHLIAQEEVAEDDWEDIPF